MYNRNDNELGIFDNVSKMKLNGAAAYMITLLKYQLF